MRAHVSGGSGFISSARAGRRAAGAVLFLLFLTLLVVSGACTLLADFVDRPAEDCDGGGCADAGLPTRDAIGEGAASPEASRPPGDAAPVADAKSSGETGPAVAPCEGLKSGAYCANDGLHDYPGAPSDLVFCDGGAVAVARPCDAGCLALMNPFPDTCNACDQKPNGVYCGRDFSGFPLENADFLIQCQATNAVQIVACARGCLSRASGATCAP